MNMFYAQFYTDLMGRGTTMFEPLYASPDEVSDLQQRLRLALYFILSRLVEMFGF